MIKEAEAVAVEVEETEGVTNTKSTQINKCRSTSLKTLSNNRKAFFISKLNRQFSLKAASAMERKTFSSNSPYSPMRGLLPNL